MVGRKPGVRLNFGKFAIRRRYSLILIIQIEIMVEKERMSNAKIADGIYASNLRQPPPSRSQCVKCQVTDREKYGKGGDRKSTIPA